MGGQVTTNGGLLSTGSQFPLTTDGELLDDAPVDEQIQQYLENVSAILRPEGGPLDDVFR